MIGNMVIGVPCGMKLCSISETKLQVVSTLLLIRVVRSIVSCLNWDKSVIGTVRGLVIWVQLCQNLLGRISSYLKIRFSLFRLNSLVFILSKNATTGPNIFFRVCLLTFSSLTTRKPIILYYLWLSSEFYLLGLFISYYKESSAGKALHCGPYFVTYYRIYFICVVLYTTEIFKVFFFIASISPVYMSPQSPYVALVAVFMTWFV